MKAPKIIVALDFDDENKILNLVNILKPYTSYFKIGFEAFIKLGPQIVDKLNKLGCKVFLDIKLFDIPNTMAKALKVAQDLNVFMVNLHLLAGKEAILKTLDILNSLIGNIENKKTIILGVTTLTSYSNENEFFNMFNFKYILKNFEKDPIVYSVVKSAYEMKNYRLVLSMFLAKIAKETSLDGVVCSVQESKYIKTHISNKLITVCPGIRPVWASSDDQKAISTPSVAKENLVDYMVIGRPITQALNPEEAIKKILTEIEKV